MINWKDHDLDYMVGIILFKDTTSHSCNIVDSINYPGKSHCREIGLSETDMFLQHLHYKMYGKPMSDTALKKLNALLIYVGTTGDLEYVVHRRVAKVGNNIYIDLGNKTIAKVTPKGVRIVEKAPVKFLISNSIGKIAAPDLDDPDLYLLKKYVPANTNQFKLIIVFIINCYLTDSHYVGLILIGEPGSGKSFASKVLKTIIDNSSIKLRNQMRKTEDLIVATEQSHLIVINNASKFSIALQDTLCTILTSGTAARRALYTNKSESFIQTHNPVIINGVENPLTQSDAIDRCITIHLSRISDSEAGVISERQLEQDFENDLPKIVGGVFELLSAVLARLIDFEPPPGLTRMADFHILGLVCEEVLGWKEHSFNRAYEANIALAQNDALEDSPVSEAMLTMKNRGALPYEGTYADLKDKLNKFGNVGNIDPRKLRSQLDYIASPLLNIHGIKITRITRSNKGSKLRIELV